MTYKIAIGKSILGSFISDFIRQKVSIREIKHNYSEKFIDFNLKKRYSDFYVHDT